MTRPGETALRVAAAVVAVLGLGVATYIAISEAGGGSPACLAGGGGCERVANSPYSELAGINVAVLGIGGYVALLAAALLRGDPGRAAGFGFGLIGFAFSAYLTYLELFVIDAICQWCVASAVLMTVLFALGAARAALYIGRPAAPPGAGEDHQGGGVA